ncbi:MAG TPA: DUF1648 domain-containing protein [Candidatus Aenigmarchaeota archaeon]|nr:DUF1648 domain-containing protein [Candidatus Aenigmarchaeota archaeon]
MEKVKIAMSLLIFVSFLVSFISCPMLPEKIVSHWNAKGEPDSYMPRYSVFFLPMLMLCIAAIFYILPKIDPLRENYRLFKKYYDALIISLLLFLLYVHGVSVAINLGYEIKIGFALLPMLSGLFLFLGYLLPKCKRNWFVGIKTPWTMSSDKVWEKTHRLGGKLFMLFGIYLLFFTLFYSRVAEIFFWIFLTPLILIAAVLFVYSYLQYVKEVRK